MPFAAGINYRTYQEDESTPVVLLHGAGGSQLSWSPQIRRLSGYRVYALDLPGHGKSRGGGEQSIPAYTKCVLEWMDSIELNHAIFVGHSMGGAIAQSMALDFPEYVLGLGLIGTASNLTVNPQLLEETASAEKFQSAIEKIIAWSFDPACPPRLMELVTRRLAETRPGVLYGDLIACNGFDMTEHISEIRCPTLVVCGANDKMTPPRNAQSLASRIPGAHLEVISAAGHMVMLEKPQAVADVLAQFFMDIHDQSQ
jgi:pimeloyl-ACP methyl ester carboxylesterase